MSPFLGRGASSQSNIMSPGPRRTSVPSGILIYPLVWPQHTRAKIGGCAPFGGGEMGPHLTQSGQGQGLPPCQVSSFIRPTVWPQYTNVTDRADRQTGQRSDRIGRTVLETVAPKPISTEDAVRVSVREGNIGHLQLRRIGAYTISVV